MSGAASVSSADPAALAGWTAGTWTIDHAEHSPTMTFARTGLRQENGAWVLTGDLTIKAVTRPAGFEVEFLGVDPTGLQGESRIGFSARGAIMRRDFGITFGLAADSKVVVGDKVDITLDAQAVLDS